MVIENPRQKAQSLIDTAVVSLFELWMKYWGEGGRGGEMELDAFIRGVPLLDDFDEVILGWALEELITQ
ncbi:hypothetical protein [Pseudarthrobacter sp. NPDC057230]|uniref:hypothetical protein n=1 Tax=Pseudarthrobacter sp. NPDC057230 TaxID=3346057 RepID=UPI00363B5218